MTVRMSTARPPRRCYCAILNWYAQPPYRTIREVIRTKTPGLVVKEERWRCPPQMTYLVSHQRSGDYLGLPFCFLSIAVRFANALGRLADWTLPAETLRHRHRLPRGVHEVYEWHARLEEAEALDAPLL